MDMRSGNFRSAPEIPRCPFRELDSCVKRVLCLSSTAILYSAPTRHLVTAIGLMPAIHPTDRDVRRMPGG